MSDRIKKQVIPHEDNILDPKTFSIAPWEMKYLQSIDNVKRSMAYYYEQLSMEYIKILSLRLGYRVEQNLEFKIDLADPKRELTITIVPGNPPDSKLHRPTEPTNFR